MSATQISGKLAIYGWAPGNDGVTRMTPMRHDRLLIRESRLTGRAYRQSEKRMSARGIRPEIVADPIAGGRATRIGSQGQPLDAG